VNSARFRFDGMAELIAGLRQLPADLAGEAGRVVIDAAEGAAAEIREKYPIGPGDDDYEGGNLKSHVKVVEKNAGQFGHVRQVRSSAKHAWIFESGTQTRQTALGYNRGFMPGANIFVPTVRRYRRAMYEDLREILRNAGLDVRG